jgi:DNA-binding response OmpR family regulator
VLHSAFIDAAEWLRARQAGADDWFLKQIGAEALVERLVEAVRRCLPPERWQSIA